MLYQPFSIFGLLKKERNLNTLQWHNTTLFLKNLTLTREAVTFQKQTRTPNKEPEPGTLSPSTSNQNRCLSQSPDFGNRKCPLGWVRNPKQPLTQHTHRKAHHWSTEMFSNFSPWITGFWIKTGKFRRKTLVPFALVWLAFFLPLFAETWPSGRGLPRSSSMQDPPHRTLHTAPLPQAPLLVVRLMHLIWHTFDTHGSPPPSSTASAQQIFQ